MRETTRQTNSNTNSEESKQKGHNKAHNNIKFQLRLRRTTKARNGTESQQSLEPDLFMFVLQDLAMTFEQHFGTLLIDNLTSKFAFFISQARTFQLQTANILKVTTQFCPVKE